MSTAQVTDAEELEIKVVGYYLIRMNSLQRQQAK
jgi:hypothetical protein